MPLALLPALLVVGHVLLPLSPCWGQLGLVPGVSTVVPKVPSGVLWVQLLPGPGMRKREMCLCSPLLLESTTPGWCCPGDPRKVPQGVNPPLGMSSSPVPTPSRARLVSQQGSPSPASQRLQEHAAHPSAWSSVRPWQGHPAGLGPAGLSPPHRVPGHSITVLSQIGSRDQNQVLVALAMDLGRVFSLTFLSPNSFGVCCLQWGWDLAGGCFCSGL